MPIGAAAIMVLTFVLGIVPATLLAMFAVIVGVVGAFGLLQFGQPGPALSGLFLVAVSVLAVGGYVALFYAAGDLITRRVAQWLLGGVFANLVGIGLVVDGVPRFETGAWLLFGGPLLVGSAHLVRYAARARKQVAASS